MIVTAIEIRTFAVLLLIFIFIFTLLGMELFGFKVRFNNEQKEYTVAEGGVFPRINFNDPLNGFVAIFIIFIGEDWNSVMYDHVRATSHISIAFFVAIFMLGNLVLLNLFLAILLKNFEEPPGKEEDPDQDAEPKVSVV